MKNIKFTPKTKIFAENIQTEEVFEITNHLYFFEEQGIYNMNLIDRDGDQWEVWIEHPEQQG